MLLDLGEPRVHLLQEVGVADPPPVLAGEAQVHRQLRQRVGDAAHGGRVQGGVAGGERLSAAGCLLDRGLARRASMSSKICRTPA
jgi:hypothetical protein